MDTCNANRRQSSSLEQKFIWSLLLNGAAALAEMIASVLTGSSALLADGLMNVDDFAALALSIYSERKRKQGPDARRTFGYGRMDEFAGFVKGNLLLLTAFITVLQAVRLLLVPETISSTVVIVMGFVTLGVNFFSAYVLKADACCSINAKTTYSCMKYDAYGSVALIISGVLGRYYPTVYFDVVAALLIAFFMVRTGWEVFREGTRLFLQSAPKDFNYDAFEKAVLGVKNVQSVGDIHVWTLTPNEHHLTCKATVKIEDVCDCDKIISAIEKICRKQFNIQHCTIQPVYSEEVLRRFCKTA
jgi:cobalt-zinc-cadmium efflux system protein